MQSWYCMVTCAIYYRIYPVDQYEYSSAPHSVVSGPIKVSPFETCARHMSFVYIICSPVFYRKQCLRSVDILHNLVCANMSTKLLIKMFTAQVNSSQFRGCPLFALPLTSNPLRLRSPAAEDFIMYYIILYFSIDALTICSYQSVQYIDYVPVLIACVRSIDMKAERNEIWTTVYPALRAHCLSHGLDFSFVDMR